MQPLVVVLLSMLFKTSWEGAQTSVHCAVAMEMEGVSGVFLRDCTESPLLTAASQDEHMASKLWTVSSKLVGLE